MPHKFEQTHHVQPSARPAAHPDGSRGISMPAVPVLPLPKKEVIQGVFMIGYTNGIPTYLSSPLSTDPDDAPAKPDNYIEEDLDAQFEAAGDKAKYWHIVKDIFTFGRLLSPGKADFSRYMEAKRQELGIADIWKIRSEGPGVEGGVHAAKDQQALPLPGSRIPSSVPVPSAAPRPRAALGEAPDLQDRRVKALAESLFASSALGDSDIRQMIDGTLGNIFSGWARGSAILDEDALQASVQQVVNAKLAEFRKKYKDLELMDVIVIFAYSWRADTFMRKEMESTGWKSFGKWERFAEQLKASLRKLRRFTGEELYRCGRAGHEGAKLEKGQDFPAHSFLSTTYDQEALSSLEKDPKYAGGDTLKMSGKMEGYHMEEFSNFEDEREVILLPGHSLSAGKGGRSGRNIDIAVTPPPDARPPRPDEPDAVRELEDQRKAKRSSIAPPPLLPFGGKK